MERQFVECPGVDALQLIGVDGVEDDPEAKVLLVRFGIEEVASLAECKGKVTTRRPKHEERSR